MNFPEDVRGWLYKEEGWALHAYAEGKVVLEIGSYCGRSTICLAQSAQEVHCVDPFLKVEATAPETDGQNVFDEFLNNMRRYGVYIRVYPHIGYSQDVLPKMIGREFGFAFIDGAHDEASVQRDLELTLALMKPGSWIAFHDYSQSWPDVIKVVDRWRGNRTMKRVGDLALVEI